MIQQWVGIIFCACFVKRKVEPQLGSFLCAKCETKNKSLYPKVRGTHINYILSKYLKYIHLTITTRYTITNYFRYRIQIEVFDAIDKIFFVIFDRDAEKILNKSVRDLVEKKINIGEEIPYDLKKIFGKKKKSIFLLHLNEFNLKDDFENFTVAKIF